MLEVLVALTIVGLGVVTLLQIFSLGLRLGTRSTQRTELAAEGAQVMDDLLARKSLPQAAATGVLPNNVRWTAEVRTLTNSPSALGLSSNWELKEVVVGLAAESGGERLGELKTLRLAKKASP